MFRMRYIYLLIILLFAACKTISESESSLTTAAQHSEVYWLSDLRESATYIKQANLPKTYIKEMLNCPFGKRRLLYTAVIHKDKINKTQAHCYIIATITILDDTTQIKEKISKVDHLSIICDSEKKEIDCNTLFQKYTLNCGENSYEVVTHHTMWRPNEIISLHCINYDNNKAFEKHHNWFMELGKTKPIKIKNIKKPCIIKAYKQDILQDIVIVEEIKNKAHYLFLTPGLFTVKQLDMSGNLVREYTQNVL